MRDPRIHGIPEPANPAGSGAPVDAVDGPEAASSPGAGGASRPAPAADVASGPAPGAEAPAAAGAGSEEPEAAGADAEPESEALDVDVAALSEQAAQAQEYLELAQRTRAEFDNYRKRAMRDAKAAQERGATKLALELLPAIDNLDRALAHAASTDENGDGSLIAGIKHVRSDLIAALKRAEIEPYSPEGEPFDPQYHEAVAQQPIEGAEPGTVVEVYQRGYRRGESVLRPARVVVAG
jgi:molecular chaperone GrpE